MLFQPKILVVALLGLPLLGVVFYLYHYIAVQLIRIASYNHELPKDDRTPPWHNNPSIETVAPEVRPLKYDTDRISISNASAASIVDGLPSTAPSANAVVETTMTDTTANRTINEAKAMKETTTNHTINKAKGEVRSEPAIDETLNSWFFVNYIQSTRIPTNATCHRTCSDFRNRIYFSPRPVPPGAGLIDVLTTIGTLLNMAGYLCARVYVPRPTFMLTSRHNDNRPLSPNMSWSDYGDFRLWNDPQRQPALIDWDNPHDPAKWPVEASLLNESVGLRRVSEHATPRQVKSDFKRMEDFTAAQQRKPAKDVELYASQGFIWIIQSEYFHWCNFLVQMFRLQPFEQSQQAPFIFADLEFNKEGCQYAQVGLSQELQELRSKVVEQVLQQADVTTMTSQLSLDRESSTRPLLGYFHIRRNDASGECKTRPGLVKAYLTCSLGDAISSLSELLSHTATASPAHRRVIVMYSTDDKNEAYRLMVKELIELQQQRSLDDHVINVTAVDLDHTVERVLRKEIQMGNIPEWRLNAYYIFQLIFSIGYNQTITPFHMERRRGLDCRACDNVTSQLIQAGVFDIK